MLVKPSICLLVSGKLGLIVLERLYGLEYSLAAVFTNQTSHLIIDFCKNHGIPIFIGNPRNGKANNFIKAINCDVLLSVNYLFIIEKDLIQLPKSYSINIHGSLLPKYRGRTPHVWAIINGETETGITAHLIDEEVDNGAIIKQVIIPITNNDTGGSILSKFAEIYPNLVEGILEEFSNNNVIISTSQEVREATYFGKRSPEDGQINWDWSRERIRNWIRAQARPYPGAFTFYKGIKLIVHKATHSDWGFHQKDSNGTILNVFEDGIIVKTSTGALLLNDFENRNGIRFVEKELLI